LFGRLIDGLDNQEQGQRYHQGSHNRLDEVPIRDHGVADRYRQAGEIDPADRYTYDRYDIVDERVYDCTKCATNDDRYSQV